MFCFNLSGFQGRGRCRGRVFRATSFSRAKGNSSRARRSRRAPQLEISYKEDNSMRIKLPAFPGTGKKRVSCDCCEHVIQYVDWALCTLFWFSCFQWSSSVQWKQWQWPGSGSVQWCWVAESIVAVGDKPSNSPIPVVSRALSSHIGLYTSGSSESEGKIT